MSANVGANASDIGLIVQGTLIFLSAVVGVVGFVVQSRLRQRAHLKELRLARAERHKEEKLKQLRESLHEIIGPMQTLQQQGQSMVMSFGLHASDHDSIMTYYFETMGGKEQGLKAMRGEAALFHAEPMISPRLLARIKSDPESEVARDFRTAMRCALRQCFSPLSKLLRQHMNSLNLPSREAFLAKFPALKGDPQLRKVLMLQLVNWTAMMEQIVDEEWASGDFHQVFPRHIEFPMGLLTYLIMMLDDVKAQIVAATSGAYAFNSVSWEQETEDMLKKKKTTTTTTKPQQSPKKKQRLMASPGGDETKQSKYTGSGGGDAGE